MVCFKDQNHVMLFQSFVLNDNSMEKKINIQQTLFFLKKDQAYKTKIILHQLFSIGANKNETINILDFQSIWIKL